jgi:hypothetical protein
MHRASVAWCGASQDRKGFLEPLLDALDMSFDELAGRPRQTSLGSFFGHQPEGEPTRYSFLEGIRSSSLT